MEAEPFIMASRAWEVGEYRLTPRVPGGSFLCEVGRELTVTELQDLNRVFETGIYLNRKPEEFLFRHDTILVHIAQDRAKRTLLVQLKRGEDPLNLADLPLAADSY